MLGYVRGKYGSIPIPNADVTLNQSDLIAAATAEKSALIERLRTYFDETSRMASLERRAKEGDQKCRNYKSSIYNLYSIIWQCLHRQRDVSLMRNFNRELMGNIITQQCAIYQFKLEETKVNFMVKQLKKNIMMVHFYLMF